MSVVQSLAQALIGSGLEPGLAGLSAVLLCALGPLLGGLGLVAWAEAHQ